MIFTFDTMSIIAKQIQRSNIITVYADGSIRLPEPSAVFAAYPGESGKGAVFSDNAAMATRIFEFPAVGFMWIFEPNRIRLEDKKFRTPDESKLASEFHRVFNALSFNTQPIAHGFNYDIIYRTDSVIPTGEIMQNFIRTDAIEDVRDFGWQYSLAKEKGKRLETYFFKAISPIEYSVHANFQANEPGLPKEKELQEHFKRGYSDVDNGLKHMAHQA